MSDMQAAFEEIKFELDQYDGGWIISVYEDDSPFVNGAHWGVERGIPPTLWMSDQLYDMYCRACGIENTNQR